MMLPVSFTTHVAELPSGPVHYQQGRQRAADPASASLRGTENHAGDRATRARHTVFIPTAPGFNGTPLHASVKSDERSRRADGSVRYRGDRWQRTT